MNPLEREFLDASQKRQRQEEQRWKELYEEAKQQSRRARSGQLAAQSQLASDRPENRASSLPLMLAREAVLTTLTVDGYVTIAADAALHRAVDAAPSWRMTLPRHRHTDGVRSAAFSPDGKTVVTASRDQTARLWDVETGAEIRTLEGHTGEVNSAAFSPDGKTVVTASSDQTARIWLTHVEDLLKLAESLIQREPPVFTSEERRRFGFE